jgi:hypothetical protein
MMDVLLFDLDGVLLNSAGYHRSFQESVRHIARGLGYGDATLRRSDIERFEALDITAEWDSVALCAALMLLEARRRDSGLALPDRLPLPERTPHGLSLPDFEGFLDEVERAPRSRDDPVSTSIEILRRRLDGARGDGSVMEIVERARQPERSITFQLVQLFNLGRRRFESLYAIDPGIDAESCLERYDLPTLTPLEQTALLGGFDSVHGFGGIITNRPSPSPQGIFSTPEAEIGARVAGVATLPRIASGELGARAAADGLDPQAFLKPSPIHLLAGMLAATGVGSAASVETAVTLVRSEAPEAVWRRFQGARVCVFEDAAKGLVSATAAAEELRKKGIQIRLELYGITQTPVRTEALRRVGARTFPDVGHALDSAIPGWRPAGERPGAPSSGAVA